MKIKFIQILNAVTMIFPFFAWKKHKTLSSNIVHKITKIHIPVSTLFHFTASFLGKRSKLLRLLQHTDIFLIHFSSLAGTVSILKKFFPRRKKLVKITYLSGILHLHSFINNIKYDNGNYRSCLLLITSLPVIIFKRYRMKKIFLHTLIASGLYHFNDILIVGHSCFHIVLYYIYDDYFVILKRKMSLQLIEG